MQSRSTIRFILDGKRVEIDDVDPTRTVLQYLREDLYRTGSKEGCAEGDCGACTVALVELDRSGEALQVRAINSCIQFLPTLDGKELITVENLSSAQGGLHPCQQAMVDCHGSQCGFCTPGFVMSMFALYKSDVSPSRRDIDDALAGNLCRCTGYKPIVDAAVQMYEQAPSATDDWLYASAGADLDDRDRIEALQSLQTGDVLRVSGAGRQFYAPRNVSDLAALCERIPTATILAGGTDVGLWVTKQYRELDVVIYTGGVAELVEITTGKSHLEIGAAVALTDAMQAIVGRYPALEELFLRFASPPIRNAGTLGGNIANGSPIGDSMPALLVLDTLLQLRRGDTTRQVNLNDFYLDYMQNALEPGEFVEKILIPLPNSADQVASYKISKRFDQDISALCGAYRVVVDNDKVVDAKVAYGGVAAVPVRASGCERALLGKEWNETTVAIACTALQDDFSPISDMRSSAEYRQLVAQNLLRRFFLESSGAQSERVYDYGR